MKTGKIIPFPLERLKRYPRLKEYTLRVFLVSGAYGREQEGQEIFRTLKIRGDQTLDDLHHAILCAFDRVRDRGFEFSISEDSFSPERVRYLCRDPGGEEADEGPSLAGYVTLDSLKLLRDGVCRYRSGIAEEWFHLIHVVNVGPVNLSDEYPMLIEKARISPVARSGDARPDGGIGEEHGKGPGGYSREILALLLSESNEIQGRQWENIQLRPNTRLKTAVNRLPAHWLDGMCMLLEMKKTGDRELSIQGLLDSLPREKNLRRIWSHLPASSKKMLRWILEEKGGWGTLRQVSYRFGQDAEIGWWWNEEQVPASPLGMLRLCGLVYVGKNPSGIRKAKIATIPVELRRPLREIVQTPEEPPYTLSLWNLFLQGSASTPQAPVPTRKLMAPGVPLESRWRELGKQDLEGFLKDCPLKKETESFYTHMLGRVRRDPDRFPKGDVRKFLRRMTRGRSAWNRLAAYKLGVVLFDRKFARPALKDRSAMVRQWAGNVFDPRQEELF